MVRTDVVMDSMLMLCSIAGHNYRHGQLCGDPKRPGSCYMYSVYVKKLSWTLTAHDTGRPGLDSALVQCLVLSNSANLDLRKSYVLGT